MASCLGVSRESKYFQLKHLWIQDILSEGFILLAKGGTHRNPSDVLTTFVQAAVLGQHLPKLKLFKDSCLLTGIRMSAGVKKLNVTQNIRDDQSRRAHAALCEHTVNYGHQRGHKASQGRICVFCIDSNQERQEALSFATSAAMRKAFTPRR